ncbi:MAG: MFS transporter [Chitinophagales bacterium]|jgi:PAT family beta-lactamase induction signal transducer AmpG|nr:MFS transporter [Chitinophagales bacterium]
MQTTLTIQQRKKNIFPALSENKILRYFNFVALYFAQGIPEGMLALGIPAWMAMNGKTPGEISAFAIIIVLPWSFKFIAAPLMDRYTYLPMGRKRPWVLVGQLGLVLSCINMAFVPDPLNNLNQLMIAAFFVSCFGAFQDIATDGMAVDLIPGDQQAKANGLMWGSKVIGISVSLAACSLILNIYDFKTAMLSVAVAIGIIMLVPAFLRERKGEKLAPWSKGKASSETKNLQLNNWQALFKSLYKVFTLRNSLLIALMLFICQGATKYMGTILPIFTVKELGWTNIEYSNYYASAKLIGGILGMIIGGILIDKYGKKQMINIYFFSFILFISFFSFSTMYWADKNFVFAFMIVQNTIFTLNSIAVFAVAMQCCWKKISASQFTLYMTIANMGQMTFASFIGPMTDNFNWQISLFVFAGFIAMAWIVLQFVNIDKQIQQVKHLDKSDLENEEKVAKVA